MHCNLVLYRILSYPILFYCMVSYNIVLYCILSHCIVLPYICDGMRRVISCRIHIAMSCVEFGLTIQINTTPYDPIQPNPIQCNTSQSPRLSSSLARAWAWAWVELVPVLGLGLELEPGFGPEIAFSPVTVPRSPPMPIYIQYNKYNPTQHNPTQYKTIPYKKVRYDTIQYDTKP